MLAVVAIHVCVAALGIFSSKSVLWGTVYLSVRNVFHFAVPIFFMISGALLLAPEREMTIKKLIVKYLLKYSMVILCFGGAFALIEEFFYERKLSIEIIGRSFVNMLQGKSWEHMWYMYTLLGIMFIVPILRGYVKSIEEKEKSRNTDVMYMLCVMFVFLSVVPMILSFTKSAMGIVFPFVGIYVLYMLLGYWIDREIIKIPLPVSSLIIVFSLSIVIIVSYVTQKGCEWGEILVGYSSPLIAVFSVAIFSMAKELDSGIKTDTPVIVKKLGQYSFGVYIIHMFWINIAYKVIKYNPFEENAIIGFMIVYVAVTVASLVSVAVMKKIPLLNKII